jgi:hypothetical protein
LTTFEHLGHSSKRQEDPIADFLVGQFNPEMPFDGGRPLKRVD